LVIANIEFQVPEFRQRVTEVISQILGCLARRQPLQEIQPLPLEFNGAREISLELISLGDVLQGLHNVELQAAVGRTRRSQALADRERLLQELPCLPETARPPEVSLAASGKDLADAFVGGGQIAQDGRIAARLRRHLFQIFLRAPHHHHAGLGGTRQRLNGIVKLEQQ
jgi:hypothetical protein